MADTSEMIVCKSCGCTGKGNYCNFCGQSFKVKRISLPGLLHDVFHFFTHLDKGFAYTLKKLVTTPGDMQKAYIAGERSKHQKPFSMFFICATVAAVTRYWIFKVIVNYFHTGNVAEMNFFHEYMVLIHIAMMPVYALIAFLLFYKAKYNYAEIGVLILYTVSFFLLVVSVISLLKFIWPEMDTAYVELPILTIYNVITFVNFFDKLPRWIVVIKSVVLITTLFILFQLVEDFTIQHIT
ncbi:MAG: DUF3667 domain-containing protein [Ferruginibacter sp.]